MSEDNSMVVSEGRAKLQFTLQKIGIAWSFCMVVASFNRVAVTDLGLPAAAISLLIGVYTLFGPIQPVIGRMAERWPILRYRRTPYMILGTLLGSLAFPLMPGVLLEMQAGLLVPLWLPCPSGSVPPSPFSGFSPPGFGRGGKGFSAMGPPSSMPPRPRPGSTSPASSTSTWTASGRFRFRHCAVPGSSNDIHSLSQ